MQGISTPADRTGSALAWSAEAARVHAELTSTASITWTRHGGGIVGSFTPAASVPELLRSMTQEMLRRPQTSAPFQIAEFTVDPAGFRALIEDGTGIVVLLGDNSPFEPAWLRWEGELDILVEKLEEGGATPELEVSLGVRQDGHLTVSPTGMFCRTPQAAPGDIQGVNWFFDTDSPTGVWHWAKAAPAAVAC